MLKPDLMQHIPAWFYQSMDLKAWRTLQWYDADDVEANYFSARRRASMSNWMMIIVTKGVVTIGYEGEKYQLKPMHGTILPPGTWFSQRVGKSKARVVHAPIQAVTFRSTPASPLEELQLPVVMPLGDPEAAEKTINALIAYEKPYDKKSNPHHLLGNLYIPELLFNLLAGGFKHALLHKKNPRCDWIHDVRDILRERHEDPELTIQAIAYELGMPRSELQRQFTATFNISPKQWLHRYRIYQAAKLIHARQNITIDKVMASTGYRSRPTFYAMFKKYQDCQPKALRNKQSS